MHIFRHAGNGKLYILEDLILDIRYTNRNQFSGIYAHPYNHKSDVIKFPRQPYTNLIGKIFNRVAEL